MKSPFFARLVCGSIVACMTPVCLPKERGCAPCNIIMCTISEGGVLSSCAQLSRGCYTPYTAVLPSEHVMQFGRRSRGRYSCHNHAEQSAILHSLPHAPVGNRYPIYTAILSRLLRRGPQSDSILEPRTPRVRTAPQLHGECDTHFPTVPGICTWHIGPVSSPPIGFACCLAHSFAFARQQQLCRWVTDCLEVRPQTPKLFCTS